MGFKRKGEQGYISFMKRFNLLVAVVLFAIAAVLFCLGLAIYDTKGNIMTIIGALFIIPMARFITVWVLFLPFKSVTEERFNQTFSLMKAGNLLYTDVILTSAERAYGAEFVVITGDKIFVLSKKQAVKVQEYLSDIIKRKAFAYKVACTDDEGKFDHMLKGADSYDEKTYEDEDERKAAKLERERLCEVFESYMP